MLLLDTVNTNMAGGDHLSILDMLFALLCIFLLLRYRKRVLRYMPSINKRNPLRPTRIDEASGSLCTLTTKKEGNTGPLSPRLPKGFRPRDRSSHNEIQLSDTASSRWSTPSPEIKARQDTKILREESMNGKQKTNKREVRDAVQGDNATKRGPRAGRSYRSSLPSSPASTSPRVASTPPSVSKRLSDPCSSSRAGSSSGSRSTLTWARDTARLIGIDFDLTAQQEQSVVEYLQGDDEGWATYVTADIDYIVDGVGWKDSPTSKTAREEAIRRRLTNRQMLMALVGDDTSTARDGAKGVPMCSGQIVPVPYRSSGHARSPGTSAMDVQNGELVVDGDAPLSAASSSTSLAKSAASSLTGPSSASTTPTSPCGTCPTVPPSATSQKYHPSAADRHYASVISAIRTQALQHGTKLEERFHDVILWIYGLAFTRGPCPPPISGICGKPVLCDESADRHIQAASDFVHTIWSMCNPYAISTGQWGLKASEVKILRTIICVRCIAGWYGIDVEQGIVEEEYEGKGKRRSAWR